jgi:hypothetical protein
MGASAGYVDLAAMTGSITSILAVLYMIGS